MIRLFKSVFVTGNCFGIIIQMNYGEIIIRDPNICGGQPVIRGTRVMLKTILASLADGDRIEDILQSFPTLKEEDVAAVIAFAAESAKEDLPVPGVPVDAN